jgi:hypothetical protein
LPYIAIAVSRQILLNLGPPRMAGPFALLTASVPRLYAADIVDRALARLDMPTQKKAARLDFVGNSGLDFVGLGANGRKPSMKDLDQIWYLAVGTFMAVSAASVIAFIVAFDSF